MEQFEGYIEKITYRNEENGYTVLTLNTPEISLTCIGSFPSVSEGEYLSVEGEMTVHPMYGKQLKVDHFEFQAPSDEQAIEKYLGSGAIKGIGVKMASKIVREFGMDSIRVMEEEPELLVRIKGISENKAMEIASQVIEKRETRSAMLFLQQYGITLNNAAKIYRQYGSSVYSIVRENPYKLADDISGIGFKTADEIALRMGFRKDSEYRIRSGILYVLQQAGQNGHTYLTKEQLIMETENLLETGSEDPDAFLMDLLQEKRIVIKNFDEPAVYLSSYYRMESETAVMLHDMNIHDSSISREGIEKTLLSLQKEENISLDDLQLKAVIESVENGVTIITGGPGTGKTTTINMMIRYFIKEGLDIMLGAPTGRAAKRMTEATGYEAQTIHRMLEVNGDPSLGGGYFQKNADSPLEADVIIIDEMSMVDISLMHALLKALVPGMRLILVGDVDQLPSVGPGNVLQDMIFSGVFPVIRLNRIFRQAEESDIVVNAHRINQGEIVEPKASKDFIFIKRDVVGSVVGAVITLLTKKLPDYVHSDTAHLQVLTPMRKGLLGVENLNQVLQEALNPPSKDKIEKQFSFGLFREGDKVMQIKNDYQLEWRIKGTFPEETGQGVFNGDTGIVRWISNFDETLTVEFDEGKTVIYPFSSCDELELAYAVTIHKSQGSEYPAVILPLFSGPRMLMNRNLLYTGITRAKNCVCIVGKYETFRQMILNDEEQKRYSGLKSMLAELYSLE